MGDLVILVIVVVLVAVGGVRLGMLLAPAVGRLGGHDEEDPTDGPPVPEPAIDDEPPRAEEPRDDA
jgi:hypothetical protein